MCETARWGVANSASQKSDLEHDPWASRTKHANAVLMQALVLHQVLGSPQDANRLRVADVWAGLRHRRLESRFLQNERVGVNGCWNGVNRARPSPTLTLRPLNAIGIADQVHRPAAHSVRGPPQSRRCPRHRPPPSQELVHVIFPLRRCVPSESRSRPRHLSPPSLPPFRVKSSSTSSPPPSLPPPE